MQWRPALGAWVETDGVHFHVWAPMAQAVAAVVENAGAIPLTKSADGTWTGVAPGLRAGARYRFQIDDKGAFPDPCSRFQPEGVHGPSEAIDSTAFAWTDAAWKGIALEDAIVYELHVGTFSPAGTFAGVTERLSLLADLGVTAIELMPLADFPGQRNWGYDGVDLFAPARCYGRPDDLRHLVDEAHRLGLAVFLDVVYNHLGPDGNYLGVYSPYYFTDRHHTDWGAGPNFDGEHCEHVRGFFIENALHWIHDYHIDGLRLDATHAIADDSPKPFLAELAERVHGSVSGRQALVIAEDHRNLARMLKPPIDGGWGIDAVWADDFHHEVRRLLAGDHEAYYRDYTGTPADLAATLRQGWFYCGQRSVHSDAPRGSDPAGIPPRRFVHCIQNHDQIGNRALGERLNQQIDPAAYRAASALLLCAPATPLLFMGQEWAADTPFLFFTDHNAELGPKVTEGRRKEFKHFAAFSDPETRERIPDCQAESTFLASRLNWGEREHEPHAAMLRLYKELLRLRRSVPALRASRCDDFEVAALEGGIVLLRKPADSGVRWVIVLQMTGPGAVNLLGHPLLKTDADRRWEAVLTTEDAAFSAESKQPRIDVVENGVTIHFDRPGAVILKEVSLPSAGGHALAPTLESPFPDEDAFRHYLQQCRRIPTATYRLQLQPAFTFRDARAIVPYLARLGISDVYCSPYLRATPGSTHGYDVCDYGALNPELGSDADYQAFVAELTAHGMGHVLDFVPNHMAVEPVQNVWWGDVLEHGPASPYARFFDIDWDPDKPELKNKVLLPFLGDHYGHVLERGELQLVFADGALSVRYGEVSRPIDPRQYPRVLGLRMEKLKEQLNDADPQLQEFLSILTALDHLPVATETAPERVAERLRESRLARERLAKLVQAAPVLRAHIDENLRQFNGHVGDPDSFDALHGLLEVQSYRLAYWKTAGHEINFRRFFDINQLAGLRMEEPAVFTATHALILRLIRERKITGLRLDHIDGLFDPAGYLETLQAAIFEERAADFLGLVGERSKDWREQVHTWRERERQRHPGGAAERPLYVVVEKILSADEALPPSWPIDGSSGYDFLNDLNRLFIDAKNARDMKRAYEHFTGQSLPFAEIVYAGKRTISGTGLASELNVLAQELNRLSEGDRRARDFTLFSLRQALREIVTCFPVYRTYVDARGVTPADTQIIDLAIRRARTRNPAMEGSVYDFVRAALVPDRAQLTAEEFQARLRFAMKFQQYTGPLQAKGIEDTAFYRYNVLVSLNEVGGDPQRFGGTVTQFHEANRRRLSHFAYGMLTTATHDTKRGEDARARLNALSEVPDFWRRSVSRWARLNARQRTAIEGVAAPDRNDEYLFYQALLGVWPAEPAGTLHETAPADLVKRLREYLRKAVKEAKVHTSWISPNDAYDQAVTDFVEQTLAGPRAARFLAEFLPVQQRVARLGMVNSLAQVLLKIVAPGVPDFFQGTELWDWSLVDPDNRQAVDYSSRRESLDALQPWLDPTAPTDERSAALAEMLANGHDGRVKLFVIAAGLHLRQRWRRVFLDGEYLPLEVEGEHADQVVALGRRFEKRRVVAIVPRLIGSPDSAWPLGAETWQATCVKLPEDWRTGPYQNMLTLECLEPDANGLPLANVLQAFPVALLCAETGD